MNALQKFNRGQTNMRKSSLEARKPTDPEVIVHAPKEEFGSDENQEANMQQPKQKQTANTTHHKNFGKVPAYLNKYKEEAETLAAKREELKAKRALPKGMR